MQPSSQPSGLPSISPSSSSPTFAGETNKPTRLPTVRSSPSSMPSSRPTIGITPSIPKIVNIAALPSSHNVTLIIDLSAFRDSPGAVTCIAMRRGSVPSSIGAIKSGGTTHQYLTSAKQISLVLTGLFALEPYLAYCYVQISSGLGSAYSDVIAMPRAFRTICCHEVLFSNSPVSVYDDVSEYRETSNDLSTYIFSYYLDSPPSQGSITVTPMITDLNGVTNTHRLVSVPPSAFFESSYSTSKLTGQFYLNTPPAALGLISSVSNTILVSLRITGTDAMNFTTSSTTVSILSSKRPQPAPTLVSCVFDSSGGYSVVTFDKPTDQASITGDSWPCSKLFVFADVKSTTCVWTSLSTVKVVFREVTTSSLKPKDALSVKAGMLRANCRPNTNCAEDQMLQPIFRNGNDSITLPTGLSVMVQQPLRPVVPSIVLTAPPRIGPCNDLTIDLSASTGSGGRPWSSVVWTVLVENGDATAVTAFLISNFVMTSNFVTIPGSMLTRTTYSFGATITNFLGDAASSASIVTVTGDPNIPVVSILGSVSRTIRSSDALTLQGSATVSKCATMKSLTYTWTLTNSSGVLMTSKSTSTDPRVYIAPAYSFIAGSSYTITLTVKSFNSMGLPISSGQVETKIYVAHGDVIAAIRGGYTRDSAVNRELTLDASISSDEDTATGSTGLLFSWSCTIVSLTNFGSDCNLSGMSTATTSSSEFFLPANQMALFTKYSFVVTVSSIDGRSASRSVLITPLLSGAPVVYSGNTLIKFNIDAPLSVPGTITANVTTVATWAAFYNGQPVILEKAYTKTSREFTAYEMSSSVSYPLGVPAYTFVAGRTYTFRLSSYPSKYNNLVAKTDVVLLANSPPIGGYTSVSPISGHALQTDFSIYATGWSDDLSDYPLSYNFAYRIAVSSSTPALVLTVLSPLSYATSLLPPGLSDGVYADYATYN